MPTDGDPADDTDVWFRYATHEDHIKRGRVSHAAFKGSAISRPAVQKKRSWDRELSGRLRSLAGTLQQIEQHAGAYCQEQTARGGGTKRFHGVIYARVTDAKQAFE